MRQADKLPINRCRISSIKSMTGKPIRVCNAPITSPPCPHAISSSFSACLVGGRKLRGSEGDRRGLLRKSSKSWQPWTSFAWICFFWTEDRINGDRINGSYNPYTYISRKKLTTGSPENHPDLNIGTSNLNQTFMLRCQTLIFWVRFFYTKMLSDPKNTTL